MISNRPYFYSSQTADPGLLIELDEPTSRHIVQVLRMESGEAVRLSNGSGTLTDAVIVNNHKKHCSLKVETVFQESRQSHHCMAVSPLKNQSRFEWFLEKAAELGIARIVPLICQRTEKSQVKMERMQQILISAMLQSQQAFMPQLDAPVKFGDWINTEWIGTKWIAHCATGEKTELTQAITRNSENSPFVLLIGPEGDFSEAEIQAAQTMRYQPVSLGSTRLRTETAALTGAVLLQQLA